MRPSSSPPGLLSLPDGVLENILEQLPLLERVRAPLVCKHLAELCKSSRQLYAAIYLPCMQVNSPQNRARFEGFCRWLAQRGAVRELDLAIIPPASDQHRVWNWVSYALAAVAPSLVRLHLEWLGLLLVGPWAGRMAKLQQADLMAQQLVLTPALGTVPQLTDLWVVGDDVELRQQPAPDGATAGTATAAAVGTLGCLPRSLTALSFSRAALRELPPGLTSLTGLVSLDLSYSLARFPLNLAPLTTLVSLQELTCSWCHFSRVPRHFSALTNLRVLYLHDCFPEEPPTDEDFAAALGPLHRLGMLSLSSCGLQSVPNVLLPKTSLRGLHLEDNRGLQLPPGPYLSRLLELVIDWSTLWCSHAVLGGGAAQLTRLYVSGSHRAPQPAAFAAAAAAAGAGGGGAWAPNDWEDAGWPFAAGGLPQPAVQQAQQAPEQQLVQAVIEDFIEEDGEGQQWVDAEWQGEVEVLDGPGGQQPAAAPAPPAVAQAAAPAAHPPPLNPYEGDTASDSDFELEDALEWQEPPPGAQGQDGGGGGVGVAGGAGQGAAPGTAAGAGPVPPFWGADAAAAEPAAAAPTAAAAASRVASSLAALPSLLHFVDVFPPGQPVYLEPAVAQLMYELPRACPALDVVTLQSNTFGWRLKDLLGRERDEGVEGKAPEEA